MQAFPAEDEAGIDYLVNEPYDSLPGEEEYQTRSVPTLSDWGGEKPSGEIVLEDGWLAYKQNNGTDKSGNKNKGAQSEVHIPLMPGKEEDHLQKTPEDIWVEFDWKASEADTSLYIRDDNAENLFRLNYNGGQINYQSCPNGGTPSGSNRGNRCDLSQGVHLRLKFLLENGHYTLQQALVNGTDEGISAVSNTTLDSSGLTVLILSPKGNDSAKYGTTLCAIDNLKVWEAQPEPAKVDVTLVGGEKIAAGGRMNINVHLQVSEIETDSVEFDLKYNSQLLTFRDTQPGWTSEKITDTQVEDDKNGTLHITVTDNGNGMPNGTVYQYAVSRIAKLDFNVADVGEETETTVSVEKIACGEEEPEGIQKSSVDLDFKIYPGDGQDLNGDGVIGAGDIALAGDETTQKAIAGNAKIQPYKRVLTIVTDGAGNSFNPGTGEPPYDGPYYYGSKTIEEARAGSEFAMWLHNEYMATSYSAQPIDPPSSCQNYNTFLHGVGTYGSGSTVPSEYKIDNDSAHEHYYPDFNKETPVYPSIFKTINNQQPGRKIAAFAQYASILDGVIEPDSGAYTRRGTGKGDIGPDEQMADELVDYINSGEIKDTGFTFWVLDDMDGWGHRADADGWFGDKYYEIQNDFSGFYEKVFHALKENDLLEDTLLISTADHGGKDHAHGNASLPEHMTIYFGVGGQTVENGKRMQGGETTDLGAIVLGNLGFEMPESMKLSTDFTLEPENNPFLTQEEMVKKNRDIEQVTYRRSGQTAEIVLQNAKEENTIKVVDLSLEGQVPASVQTDGTILRQEGNRMILAFDKTPDTICTVTYDQALTESDKVGEVMLGTDAGKEIYCDLVNEEAGSSQIGITPTTAIYDKDTEAAEHKDLTFTLACGEATVVSVKLGDAILKESSGYILKEDALTILSHALDSQSGTVTLTVSLSDGQTLAAEINIQDTTPAGAAHKVTVTAGTGGTASLITPKTEYEPGEKVIVSATANSGYTFSRWSSSEVSVTTSGTTGTFIMPDTSVTVHANFSKNNLGGGGGGGSRRPSSSSNSSTSGMVVVPVGENEETETPGQAPDVDHLTSNYFHDVDTYTTWAYGYIEHLASAGIISGDQNHNYNPKNNVTREEFLKMLMGALDIQATVTVGSGYCDVNSDDWFAPYVDTASTMGFVQGMGDGSFGVGQMISRQDMAVMASRALAAVGKTLPNRENVTLKDLNQISEYARTSVEQLAAAGIICGDENGIFHPANNTVREEAAKVIYMIWKL